MQITAKYWYNALVLSVYDGDTITLRVDLGFQTFTIQKIRLKGINAPELRGDERPQGILARDWLRHRILAKEVILNTDKDKTGKYGRYLGTIYLPGRDLSINTLMVQAGHAEPYNP